MKRNGYGSPINAVRRLCEAARKLPLPPSLGAQGAELDSALRAVEADLDELQAREETFRRTEQQLSQAGGERQLHYLRFQELFELSPDGCLLTNTSGVIRQASRAAASLLDCRKEFLLEKPLAFFVAGPKKEFYAYLNELNRNASGASWEVCLRSVKGEPIYVELRAVAIPNGESQLTGYFWVLRNITERKRAELRLQAEKDFANSLIESAQAIILVLDDQGRILRSNSFLQALAGYASDALLGQDWYSLFASEADQKAARTMLSEAQHLDKSKGGTYALVTQAGDLRMVAWSAKALTPGIPNQAALLLIGHDVTEAQEAQQQALTMERLAAIGRAATTLAHESRNALHRAHISLEALKLRLADRPDDLQLIARIQRAQNDLIRLYEEVRAFGAPIQIQRDRCDLAAMWREAWEQVSSLFPEKEGVLREETAGVDLSCHADRFRLIQVFRNLLENAFAACSVPVRITIACRETVLAKGPAVEIALRDNGPGLNEEQRRHIFEPFYTTKSSGTGLGTSIARRIVEAHGGQIAVADSPQLGTEIVITLPRNGA